MKAKRRLFSLATGVIFIVALATAGSASAVPYPTWSEGEASLTKTAEVELNGSLSWTTEAGGVSCSEVSGDLTLEPTNGGKLGFEIPNPSGCVVSGVLGSICGAHSLSETEFEAVEGPEGPLSIVAQEKAMRSGKIDGRFRFSPCGVEAENVGGQDFKVDNAAKIGSLSLSSAMSSSLTKNPGTININLSLTPSGKYGIKPAEFEEPGPQWSKNGSPLEQNEVLGFHGTFEIHDYVNGGGLQCPGHGVLEFVAGTGTGQLQTLQIEEGKCSGTGSYCRATAMSAEGAAESPLIDEGTKFTIEEIPLTIKTTCGTEEGTASIVFAPHGTPILSEGIWEGSLGYFVSNWAYQWGGYMTFDEPEVFAL